MPELSEVHLNALLLMHELDKKNIDSIDILSGKYLKKPPTNFIHFQDHLPLKVLSVNVLGKFIWLELEHDWIIGITFGLTGKFSLEKTRNSRIVINNYIYYEDPRNFGNWNFWPNKSELLKKLSTLGYDPLWNDVDKKDVIEKFRLYNNKKISDVLLSQKVIAGIGNYLRAEVLYDCHIYPFALIKNLSDKDLYNIYKYSHLEAKKAFTIQKPSYQNLNYDNYRTHLRIYRHEVDPKGNPITATKGKQTMYWVPKVQIIGI